ncbi:alpha/beta hydrolase [Sphaerisporangium melleum]|uniref:Alpha/beta hydrolase n=1 Tax=Sphaerisporangium melleum TaxID=321316 RepID=A0A917RNA8_9ACTN|nr:alpha/beta fold hydrolase [Sphaerisporangium melleum]GGL16826.1 alpha/beta hydrolase [Sphaerisporangium melleum]GII74642.1 alpha/beta hydrolase [Sphaerisporangium melleum]
MMSSRRPGTVFADHTFAVPLDHDEPNGAQIEVYAREVRAGGQAAEGLPWLLFLNGGPGFACLRPLGGEGWLDRALQDYRVLLLDQRGTGRSTPLDRRSLPRIGSPAEQAAHLAHFRADSIVRDAELIRRRLIGDEPWSVLGQSFGGFCTVTYLSFAPEGLAEAFVTGGLPGLTAPADEVYQTLYPQVAAKNFEHYARHPEDVERAVRVARHLSVNEVTLPTGRPFTVEVFQSLGNMLGHSTGSKELHYLLEDPFGGGDDLTDAFLFQVEAELSWTAAAPLYSLVHEACYAQGEGATAWSAQRVRARFPEFDPAVAVDGDGPLLFTGEMIYPWMFETDPSLRPLRDAAHLLAERPSWPALYDVARLERNTVPVTAAVYYNDMYVARELSMSTARTIKGARTWVTSEYEHDGLRAHGDVVLDHLLSMP